MPNSDNFFRNDPFYCVRFCLGAAWRGDLACSRAATYTGSPPDRFGDELLSSIYQLLRAEIWNEDLPTSVARDQRFLADLQQIREIHSDCNRRLSLEARVLARLPVNTVAERCDLDPEIVEMYEQVYFDIRRYLDTTSFVMTHAVGRPGEPASALRDVILKPSYFGGPLIAERLLEHLPYLGQEHDLTTAVGRERERLEINLLWARINMGEVDIKSYPQLLEIHRLSNPASFPTVSEMFCTEFLSAEESFFAEVHKFGGKQEMRENAKQRNNIAA